MNVAYFQQQAADLGREVHPEWLDIANRSNHDCCGGSAFSQTIESNEPIYLASVLSIGVRLALATFPTAPMLMAGIPVSQCRSGGSRHFHY